MSRWPRLPAMLRPRASRASGGSGRRLGCSGWSSRSRRCWAGGLRRARRRGRCGCASARCQSRRSTPSASSEAPSACALLPDGRGCWFGGCSGRGSPLPPGAAVHVPCGKNGLTTSRSIGALVAAHSHRVPGARGEGARVVGLRLGAARHRHPLLARRPSIRHDVGPDTDVHQTCTRRISSQPSRSAMDIGRCSGLAPLPVLASKVCVASLGGAIGWTSSPNRALDGSSPPPPDDTLPTTAARWLPPLQAQSPRLTGRVAASLRRVWDFGLTRA